MCLSSKYLFKSKLKLLLEKSSHHLFGSSHPLILCVQGEGWQPRRGFGPYSVLWDITASREMSLAILFFFK